MIRLTRMPSGPTTQISGVRNGRSAPGRCTRSSITAAQTMMKANRVPMLTISSSLVIGVTAATMAMIPPVNMVDRCGVRNRSWTAAKMAGGSSPSRDIARKMRAWLRKVIRSTLVMPASAPMEINAEAPSSRRLL